MGKHLLGALDNVLRLLILLDFFWIMLCFAAPDLTLRRVDGSEGILRDRSIFLMFFAMILSDFGCWDQLALRKMPWDICMLWNEEDDIRERYHARIRIDCCCIAFFSSAWNFELLRKTWKSDGGSRTICREIN